MRAAVLIALLVGSYTAIAAGPLETNEVILYNPPPWLMRTRVERVTNRIQTKLEWTTRKTTFHYHSTPESYTAAQSLGPFALAVTSTKDGVSTVHLGPMVTNKNFDQVFAHELVHVISAQKYKGSIPSWLEEGLANHLAKHEKVDYRWLAKQSFPQNVTELAHPFRGVVSQISYRYKASQALAEMLDKKCNLERLIQLSVERKMEDYIKTYCEIPDLNQAFKDWVKKKASY